MKFSFKTAIDIDLDGKTAIGCAMVHGSHGYICIHGSIAAMRQFVSDLQAQVDLIEASQRRMDAQRDAERAAERAAG